MGGTGNVTSGQLTITDGIFKAPNPGVLSVGKNNNSGETSFNYIGGVFDANFGTTTFTGYGNSTGDQFLILNSSTTETIHFYNVRINAGGLGTITNSGDIEVDNNLTLGNGTLGGVWDFRGNLTVESTADAGSAILTFIGTSTQYYTDQGGNEPDGDITINKPSGSVILQSNADWNSTSQDLTITAGRLEIPSTYNLSTNVLVVDTGGELAANGSGIITLGGNVTNNGLIDCRGNNMCGGSDVLTIQSSVNGTQRSWSGSGETIMYDVTVRDQGGTLPITLYSSTNLSNNGANWTFSAAQCPFSGPVFRINSGQMRIESGRVRVE
jgi:hypothetical protein